MKWLWLRQIVGARQNKMVMLKGTLEKCREGQTLALIDACETGMAAVCMTLEPAKMRVQSPSWYSSLEQEVRTRSAPFTRSDDLHLQLDCNFHGGDHERDRFHCGGSNGCSWDQEVRDESSFLVSEATTTTEQPRKDGDKSHTLTLRHPCSAEQPM